MIRLRKNQILSVVMIRMRLPIQAQVIIFTNNPLRFLMLKRPEDKGGFWQPVTGGVEDGETIEAAAKRELSEETALHPIEWLGEIMRFQFEENGWWFSEYVFATRVEAEPILTEHVEFRWCTLEEAQALVPEHHVEIREALGLVAQRIGS